VPVSDSGDARHSECVGYATFVLRLNDPNFSRWFEQLRADLGLLVREPGLHLERVVLLQNALVDVLDLLDPDCTRFAGERRGRLAMALTGAE
jgi:hypothetical protein